MGRSERQISRLPILSGWCGKIWGIGVAIVVVVMNDLASHVVALCEKTVLCVVKSDDVSKRLLDETCSC